MSAATACYNRRMHPWPGIIEAFRDQLDLPPDLPAITLLEGNTPLIPIPRLARGLEATALYVKFEGLNPSGSFKDRGMTVAISEAAHRGAGTVICASTGNTAASAAAYAGRAGLRCLVIIPHGAVASGKLAGALAYGAEVLQIEGTFDESLDLVRSASERLPVVLVNSLNPYRLEGQKTVAFEICEALDGPPDWLALPVGNAGNISALWMGLQQLKQEHGWKPPRLLGVQASGAAPLVEGRPVPDPHTVASAIRIGRPARGDQAVRAANHSGGRIVAVDDDQILAAQRELSREGIWVEPASAAGLAGLTAEASDGRLDLQGKKVVCICTGHGLKDPAVISDRFAEPRRMPAQMGALQEVLNE